MLKHTDPVAVVQDTLTLIKLAHLFIGIFIWDLASTLDFEWNVLTGPRPFKWTVWLHSSSRFFGLVSAIMVLLSVDATAKMDCKAWDITEWFISTLPPLLAVILIIIRIIAIWEKNKFVIAFGVSATLVNVALAIQNMTTANAVWDTDARICSVIDPLLRRNFVFSMCATDIILLGLMISGLRRWELTGETRGIFRLIYTQGFVWIVVVTLAEVPPTVMLFLNIDDAWNMTFTVSACFFPVIGATRLYRSLLDYDSARDLEDFTIPADLSKKSQQDAAAST
ncbi:hypothetical protein FA95DRAFT_1607933 [Auriscalpium vulgare]|uniref:Uncharacterized protein n=1 Tax=Auriscalpium vulgare TaxID=40419 RepID=A0ACB8RMP0_9AGAM|nr:hypothetical protein FA95DRAFT_1607933 [Auriscalpium vulgare]